MSYTIMNESMLFYSLSHGSMTVNVHMTRVEVAAGPQTTSQHRPRTNVQHLKEVPLLCPI